MSDFMYSAWFRDHWLSPSEEDHEWVAMFIVTAADKLAAHCWGDHLARGFSSRSVQQEFTRSYIEPPEDYAQCVGFDKTPRVNVGEFPADELIGW